MSPSVSTTPRTRSSAKRRSMVAPMGASTSCCHTLSSPTARCASARVSNGSVRVGQMRLASRAVSSPKAFQARWSDAAPMDAKLAAVACSSPVSTSRPRSLPGSGVYDE